MNTRVKDPAGTGQYLRGLWQSFEDISVSGGDKNFTDSVRPVQAVGPVMPSQ